MPTNDIRTRGAHRAIGVRRKLGAGAAATLALAGMGASAAFTLAVAGPASAADAAFASGQALPGDSWLGSYSITGLPGAGSDIVHCAANSIHVYPSDDVSLYGGGTDDADGDESALAWVIAKYSDDGSVDDASAADGLVSLHNQDGETDNHSWAQALGLSNLMDQEWADGLAHQGPWTVAVTGLVTSDDPSATPGSTHTGLVTVTGPNGPIAGVPVQLTSTGGVTLSTATLVTDGAGQATFTYTATAAFTVTGTAHAPVQRRWESLDHDATQSVVGTSQAGDMSGSANGSVDPNVSLVLTKLTAGHEADGPQAATFLVTDTTTGQVLGEMSTTAGQPTDLGSDFIPGHVYSFAETAAGDPRSYAPTAPFLVTIPADATASFSITLTDPAMPTLGIGTIANYQVAQVGRQLTDDVMVTGNDGESATLTGTVMGPVAPHADGSPVTLAEFQAAQHQTYALDIEGTSGDGQGNGTYRISGPVVTEPGVYGWAETIELLPSHAKADSPPTADNESTTVTQPAMSTQISQQAGAPGDQLSDHVAVTGTTETTWDGSTVSSGVIGVDLYYRPWVSDAETCSTDQDVWASDIATGRATVVDHSEIVATVDGGYDSQPYTVPADAAGCYSYGETYTAKDLPKTTVTEPGEVTETSTVASPKVSTTMSSADDGDTRTTFTDTAVVTGLHSQDAIVHIELLGPIASPDGTSCDGIDWSMAPVAAVFDDIAVTGNVTVATQPIVLDRAEVAQCYAGHEQLLMITGNSATPHLVYDSPRGATTEIALSTHRYHGTATGKSIETGRANDSGPSAPLISAGTGGLMLALTGTGLALARRKTE